MSRILAKPKNFRPVIPRVCCFCRFYTVIGPYAQPDGWACRREGYDYVVRDFGVNGLAACKHTCDRFESVFEGDGLDHIDGEELS